jgi:hypothetical protein
MLPGVAIVMFMPEASGACTGSADAGADRVTGYDFFIAHAGADKAEAEIIFELLSGESSVFLDTKCLRPGDNWPQRIQEAQLGSEVTILLISDRAEWSFYLHEEIAIAISLAQETAGSHRVVPVYLSGRPEVVPYGLLQLEGLEVTGSTPVELIARQLVETKGATRPQPGTWARGTRQPGRLPGTAPPAGARARHAPVAWVAALVVPPAAAGVLWERFAAGHPGLSAALLAAYVAMVGLAGFLAGAGGDPAGRKAQPQGAQKDTPGRHGGSLRFPAPG